MEHIVQFAISMDDEAIKKAVALNAEKVIIDDLKKQVYNILFTANYYRRDAQPGDPASTWTKQRFEDFLAEHKDEIVSSAAKELADRMARTKVVKEAAAQVAATVKE